MKDIPDPRDSSIDREDLLQSGYEGLWVACLRFDDSLNMKFSSIAIPYIRGYILRQLRDSEPIKTSRTFKEIRSVVIRRGYTLPLSSEEIEVLVKEDGLSRAQVMEYTEPIIYSIDSPIEEENNGDTISCLIPDTSIRERFTDEEIEQIIDHILKYIKPRYKDIVEEWMYAKVAGDYISQWTLGNKYNKSQPMVVRILQDAKEAIALHGEEIRSLFGI